MTAQALDLRAAQPCLSGFGAAPTCFQHVTVCNPSLTPARQLQQRSGEDAELYKGNGLTHKYGLETEMGALKTKPANVAKAQGHKIVLETFYFDF